MELSQETAAELSRRFQAASQSCESALRVVMAHQSLGEVKVCGDLVANFMGHVYANLLRELWRAFPELEPQSMQEPWVEPVAELAPEAKAALQSFAAEAQAALVYARQVLPSNETLAFGGIPEIEEALQQIRTFAEQPRFR